MLRAIILFGAVGAALMLYFSLALYVFPQSFKSMEPNRPEPIVMNVSLRASEIEFGQAIVVSITGANRGEDADMQIVSVGFPNLTGTNDIDILAHNFAQTPILISIGDKVGSEYSGTEKTIEAQYASVEAFSRPWPGGNAYSIDLQVRPETEGRFAIFVKSVAFPHSWDGAHWPQEGVVDYQKEFVEVYYVEVVTKP